MTVGDLARGARADVAEHGAAVLLGAASQARQLRRVQAALRAAGYQARYQSDDGGRMHQLIVTAAGQEMPQTVGWWGGLPLE
jgi:cell division septation protein DedD